MLNLLAELSAESGLLVVADDAHWLDRSSLDALAFASRRLAAEHIALILGVRGNAALPGFDHDVEELRLRPLAAADASRLLDQQPLPPRGRARQQVLSQAAGNPMALIELSSAIAADPAARQRWDTEPLPLTDRLTAVITAQLAALPAATRHALLLASIAASGAGAAAIVLSGLEPGALVPAEELGLVRPSRRTGSGYGMRAFAVRAFGESPGICDLPVPAAEDSVLVRVSCAGVNPVDVQLIDQLTSASVFPFVLGVDVAGVVERVPASVADLRVGDHVFGMARTHGSYAEYTAIASGARTEPLASIPDGVADVGDSRHAPLLVPPGPDRYHPPATGLEIAALAPAGVVFEPWKDSPRHIRQAAAAVRDFLQAHTPRAR